MRVYKTGLSCPVRESRAYATWARMKARCDNPNNPKYKHYGGRGISYCAEWKEFKGFYSDMGDPAPKMSLDRIDVNGNYHKDNCRWATNLTQSNNRRTNRFLTFQGETLSVAEWNRKLGFSTGVVSMRLNTLGWTEEEALTILPVPGNNQKLRT